MENKRAAQFSKTSPRFDEKGATTLEAATVVFPFLLIILGIVQLAMIAFQSVSLQYTLSEATRWGVLGYTLESPDQPGIQLSRGDSMTKRLEEQMQNLVHSEELNVFFCSLAQPNCTNHENPPGSQQWMVIRAEKTVRGVLGFGVSTVSASILAMNEPF